MTMKKIELCFGLNGFINVVVCSAPTVEAPAVAVGAPEHENANWLGMLAVRSFLFAGEILDDVTVAVIPLWELRPSS